MPNTAVAVVVKEIRILFMPKTIHRADGGHDDGGNAHGVDVADDGGLGAEALQAQLYVRVAGGVDDHRDEGGNDLAQYGSQGGAGHLHAGQTEQTEDQDGVQYDVDDGAQSWVNIVYRVRPVAWRMRSKVIWKNMPTDSTHTMNM